MTNDTHQVIQIFERTAVAFAFMQFRGVFILNPVG